MTGDPHTHEAHETHAEGDASAPPLGRRTGRPRLTERRKAATRLEIAHEAIRLFAAHGFAATSAEQIAAAAGVSVRTLWRYSPTKEGCVQPLLSTGITAVAELLARWPADRPLAEAWESGDESDADPVDYDTALALVRLTRTEPALRAVWRQAHHDAEPVFAEHLARRAGCPAGDLATKVHAAMINAALATALEHYAWTTDGPVSTPGVRATVAEALRVAARGLPG
jgi:AcrR family transcriptional regulator